MSITRDPNMANKVATIATKINQATAIICTLLGTINASQSVAKMNLKNQKMCQQSAQILKVGHPQQSRQRLGQAGKPRIILAKHTMPRTKPTHNQRRSPKTAGTCQWPKHDMSLRIQTRCCTQHGDRANLAATDRNNRAASGSAYQHMDQTRTTYQQHAQSQMRKQEA